MDRKKTHRLTERRNYNRHTVKKQEEKEGLIQSQESMGQSALHIPKSVQRVGTALLHQQMWCWGYDIRRSEGNVLYQYGFTCQRPPDDVRGSSAYTLWSDCGRRIMLWGFGLLYAQAGVGSVFLRRYSFTPHLTASSDLLTSVWTPEHLPALCVPLTLEEAQRAQFLLTNALHWISEYEQWVQENYGGEYRRVCLMEWKQTVVLAEKVAYEWEHLAKKCSNDSYIRVANKMICRKENET